MKRPARWQERRRREHRAAKDDEGEARPARGLDKRNRAPAHQAVRRKSKKRERKLRHQGHEHEDEKDAIADHAPIMRLARCEPLSHARHSPHLFEETFVREIGLRHLRGVLAFDGDLGVQPLQGLERQRREGGLERVLDRRGPIETSWRTTGAG